MTTETQCELVPANKPQSDLTATPVPDEQLSISGRCTLVLSRSG